MARLMCNLDVIDRAKLRVDRVTILTVLVMANFLAVCIDSLDIKPYLNPGVELQKLDPILRELGRTSSTACKAENATVSSAR